MGAGSRARTGQTDFKKIDRVCHAGVESGDNTVAKDPDPPFGSRRGFLQFLGSAKFQKLHSGCQIEVVPLDFIQCLPISLSRFRLFDSRAESPAGVEWDC